MFKGNYRINPSGSTIQKNGQAIVGNPIEQNQIAPVNNIINSSKPNNEEGDLVRNENDINFRLKFI